ncbi:unnamed protein product [Penicillium egyptiacum]|uniref:MARVEL domain-containing protein n=1 Tax=Penicillium egyptiacum TaxID=1303716 RepID=A0A9W4KFZ2_9EURO|nr:unnamed protein product [Penicillium egyptiacum]
MTFPWIYPIRVVQALFGVVVIGLTGYVVSTFYYGWSYSDTVNFLLFLGCWTAFVAVPYLAITPIWFPRLAHHYVIPAVEVITMIFWFAGFIAMGAMLPPPRWCHGSACSSLQAATVFGAFEWCDSLSLVFLGFATVYMVRELTVIATAYRVLFVVTSYFGIVGLMHHRRGGEAKTHTNVQMGV